VESYCPEGIRIGDGYHAVEPRWSLGREAYGEEAEAWVQGMKAHLWRGEVEEVVAGCQAVLAERDEWSDGARRAPDYFRECAEQMRYPAFRAAGYPIGSGTVESGCKGKGGGQRWKGKGLMAVLALRGAGMGGKQAGPRPGSKSGRSLDLLPTKMGHTCIH